MKQIVLAAALLASAALPAIANEADSYRQGFADWQTYKPWFDAQTGDRAAGVKFWAANRNVPGHKSCTDAASDYKTFGDKLTFTVGCQEAQSRLDPIDARRHSDPEYRLGFADAAKGTQANAPVAVPTSVAAPEPRVAAPEPPKFTYVVSPPRPVAVEPAPVARAEPPQRPVLASSPVGPDLRQAISETGCTSKFSDDKKADVFQHNYQDREFVTNGYVGRVKGTKLGLKVLSTTITDDIDIAMTDASSIYNLEEGQRVTVRYTLTEAGGCFLNYQGKNGVIVQH